MARREGQQRQEGYGPPGGGVDPMSLATLVGVVAVLVISFATWRDVSRLDGRVSDLEARIDQVGSRAPAQAQQRGPDPNRVYTVRTDGAPVRGKARAPVTIAEFSDFQ
jgi:protein-disulfide isomerase